METVPTTQLVRTPQQIQEMEDMLKQLQEQISKEKEATALKLRLQKEEFTQVLEKVLEEKKKCNTQILLLVKRVWSLESFLNLMRASLDNAANIIFQLSEMTENMAQEVGEGQPLEPEESRNESGTEDNTSATNPEALLEVAAPTPQGIMEIRGQQQEHPGTAVHEEDKEGLDGIFCQETSASTAGDLP